MYIHDEHCDDDAANDALTNHFLSDAQIHFSRVCYENIGGGLVLSIPVQGPWLESIGFVAGGAIRITAVSGVLLVERSSGVLAAMQKVRCC